MRNENDERRNALGQIKRSSKREGLVGSGTLGSLAVTDAHFDTVTFNIGTGFTAQMRADLWARREALKGSYAKYRFFERGPENTPRFPVFLGIRDRDDI